jgi:hypothetical protein
VERLAAVASSQHEVGGAGRDGIGHARELARVE